MEKKQKIIYEENKNYQKDLIVKHKVFRVLLCFFYFTKDKKIIVYIIHYRERQETWNNTVKILSTIVNEIKAIK